MVDREFYSIGGSKGRFLEVTLIEDIFSRYPVGWEVHEEETGELAAELLQRSVIGQRCSMTPLVLHSDNGAPMKSYASLDQARRWVQSSIHWYSHEYRQSGIQFVTPAERHLGQDQAILAQRKAVYEIANAKRQEALERCYESMDMDTPGESESGP
ncbi:hypothetical protein JQN73_03910 [Glaciimonas sp. PAMC28666]|nr:hypothetical protein JQN73_03910 [Glaciimonas sp. PAMC28666]